MSETRSFGWKHIWRAPRAVYRGATLEELTQRGRWLLRRSKLRAMDNPRVIVHLPMTSELGTYDNFRFVQT